MGMDHRPVEIRHGIGRVVADGLVEIGQREIVLFLSHVERTAAVVSRRVVIVGPDGLAVVFVGLGRVFEIEVARAAVQVGVRDLGVVTDERVEIGDRLLELLAHQVGDAPAVIRSRPVGTQVDGRLKILQRIVVIAQPHVRDGPVLESRREDGIAGDGQREIVLGTQQIVEVVLGDTAQEVAFGSRRIDPQQDIEHLDGVLILVVHEKGTADMKEVRLVELCPGRGGNSPCRQQKQEQKESTHALRPFRVLR